MRESKLPLYQQPAKRGARLILLRRLRDAERAFAKADSADPEGLHAFRVALRRTRTVVRLYRPWLQESITRKSENRLRRLSRASNRARDFEVFADVARKLGLQDVTETLFGHDQQRTLRKFRKVVAQEFPSLVRALKQGLSHYSVAVKSGRRESLRFGAASAEVVERLTNELVRQLSAVASIDQQDEAHAARITAKRLRYTLEPFRRDIPACRSAVNALKVLQNHLGELHDYYLLAQEMKRRLNSNAEGLDVSRGARAVQQVDEANANMFHRVAAQHFGASVDAIANLVRAAAAELRKNTRGDVEIERKYLLRALPRVRGAERLEILQGYLPGGRIHERVRAVSTASGKKYYRTIKAGNGMVRTEVEEEIDHDLFQMLWRLTRGRRIRKRRYLIASEQGVWAIDKFKDRTLYLAEIELEVETTKVVLPKWLRSFVVSDVTDDPAYTNHALAK